MLPFEVIPQTPTPFNPIGHFIPTRTPMPASGVSSATIAQAAGDSNLALAICVVTLAVIVIFIVWSWYVNSYSYR